MFEFELFKTNLKVTFHQQLVRYQWCQYTPIHIFLICSHLVPWVFPSSSPPNLLSKCVKLEINQDLWILKLLKSKFYIFKFKVVLHICILREGKEFIHLLPHWKYIGFFMTSLKRWWTWWNFLLEIGICKCLCDLRFWIFTLSMYKERNK
jgi:hypothetical protein